MKRQFVLLILIIFVPFVLLACNQNNSEIEKTESSIIEEVPRDSSSKEFHIVANESIVVTDDSFVVVNGVAIEREMLEIDKDAIIESSNIISVSEEEQWFSVILINSSGIIETKLYDIKQDMKLIYEFGGRYLETIPQNDGSVLVKTRNKTYFNSSFIKDGTIIDNDIKDKLGIDHDKIFSHYNIEQVFHNEKWLIVTLMDKAEKMETKIYDFSNLHLIYESAGEFSRMVPQEDGSTAILLNNKISIIKNGEVIDELVSNIESEITLKTFNSMQIIGTQIEVSEFSRIDNKLSGIFKRTLFGESGNACGYELFYVNENIEIKIGEEGVAISTPAKGKTADGKYYVFSDVNRANFPKGEEDRESCLNFIDMKTGESMYKHSFYGTTVNYVIPANKVGSLKEFRISNNSIHFTIRGEWITGDGPDNKLFIFKEGQVKTVSFQH